MIILSFLNDLPLRQLKKVKSSFYQGSLFFMISAWRAAVQLKLDAKTFNGLLFNTMASVGREVVL